jgi:hypothetical protein
MVKKKNWQEIKTIVLAAIILGFVFGFNDKKEIFQLSQWLTNFIEQVILSLIFLLIFVYATKRYSYKRGFISQFSLWNIKRYGFAKSWEFKNKGIPAGIIFGLFLALASYGKAFFSAILMPNFSYKKEQRIGKKLEAPTELELSMASLVGPMTLTILGIILTAFNNTSLNNLSLIPFSIAFCSMLPISRLNGAYVYFCAPAKYIFSVVLIITTYALTSFTTPVQSILIGITSSVIIMALFYVFSYIID